MSRSQHCLGALCRRTLCSGRGALQERLYAALISVRLKEWIRLALFSCALSFASFSKPLGTSLALHCHPEPSALSLRDSGEARPPQAGTCFSVFSNCEYPLRLVRAWLQPCRKACCANFPVRALFARCTRSRQSEFALTVTKRGAGADLPQAFKAAQKIVGLCQPEIRNGFISRSSAIVVDGPWPGNTIVSSGNASSFKRIERIIS